MTSKEVSPKVTTSTNSCTGLVTHSHFKGIQHKEHQTSVGANKMAKCIIDFAQVDIIAAEDLMFDKLTLHS